MIYWYGKYYTLITSPYNGSVLGYLLDGILLHSKYPSRDPLYGDVMRV